MNPLCLVVLGGGGWYEETRRILLHLSPREFRFAYAYACHTGDHSAGSLPMPYEGPRFPLHYLGYTYPRRFDRLRHVWRMARALIESWVILRRLGPDCVLGLGCASAVPLFMVARLMGIRCVFVESVTRTRELSLTGRLVYFLRLATTYVQWPGLTRCYPRARYAGAVL